MTLEAIFKSFESEAKQELSMDGRATRARDAAWERIEKQRWATDEFMATNSSLIDSYLSQIEERLRRELSL